MYEVTKKDQVATIRMGGGAASVPPTGVRAGAETNMDEADMFDDLRGDNSIRVIVITGAQEGLFGAAPLAKNQMEAYEKLSEPVPAWNAFTGTIRTLSMMVAMEKPIVARVNGPAIGQPVNFMFASDIIVAREDAIIGDHHCGGPINVPGLGLVGSPLSLVPGDGGCAFAPLYMTPAKVKEYLMLAKPYTARELADMGIINYAVPAADLDNKVNEIVQKLLARGAYALAWTKRIINRRVEEQLNRSMDGAAAYEMVNFLQNKALGYKNPKTL